MDGYSLPVRHNSSPEWVSCDESGQSACIAPLYDWDSND